MRKNLGKQMRTLALAGVMSMTLLGCGGNGGMGEDVPSQEEEQQGASEQGEKEEPEVPQSEEEPERQSREEGGDEEGKAGNAGAQYDEEPIGEITELGDGQFTIKKYLQEKGEDGSDILISPEEGAEDESGLELEFLTVLCDGDTHIYKRTIRDGGANYEDEESSFEKLEKGMSVNLKGSYEGEVFWASEVQITETIL